MTVTRDAIERKTWSVELDRPVYLNGLPTRTTAELRVHYPAVACEPAVTTNLLSHEAPAAQFVPKGEPVGSLELPAGLMPRRVHLCGNSAYVACTGSYGEDADFSGLVVAYDLQTASVMWISDAKGDFSDGLVVTDRYVYVLDYHQLDIVVLNVADGKQAGSIRLIGARSIGGMALHGKGLIVTDPVARSIKLIAMDGNVLEEWCTAADDIHPCGIASSGDRIYVTDRVRDHVHVWSNTGKWERKWESPAPSDICVHDGHVYTNEGSSSDTAVRVFDLYGDPVVSVDITNDPGVCGGMAVGKCLLYICDPHGGQVHIYR